MTKSMNHFTEGQVRTHFTLTYKRLNEVSPDTQVEAEKKFSVQLSEIQQCIVWQFTKDYHQTGVDS